MTDAGFKTLFTEISIPAGLSDFQAKQQYAWTTSDGWAYKNSVGVNYGPAATTWNSTSQATILRRGNLYSRSQNDGFKVQKDAGGGQESLYMLEGLSRWMPASVFNGVGFETYLEIESNNRNHQLYLAAYATVFKHRTNTGVRYYGIDLGYSDGPGYSGYRYNAMQSTSSHVNTIRSWGPDWLLQGLLMSFKTATGGTGTTKSDVTVYNLKWGNKYSTNSSSYRVLPLKMRSSSGRDMHAGATNKFISFK